MDDLLDLNWSSPPKPPASGSAAGGLAAPPKSSSTSPSPSSFDFLTIPSTTSAASTSRIPQSSTLSQPRSVGTPNYYATPPLRSSTPATSPLPSSSTVPTGIVGAGKSNSPAPPNDAFSSLLSLSSSGSSSSAMGGKNLSMAEKQKQLEEQKRKQEAHERAQFDHGEFWDKHGAPGGVLAPAPVSASTFRNQPVPSGNGAQFADLLAPTPKAAAPTKPPAVISAPAQKMGIWDDPAFFGGGAGASTSSSSKATSPAPPPVNVIHDDLDFDLLDGSSRPSRANGTKGNGNLNGHGTAGIRSGMRTPESDFDFGDGPNMDRADSISPPLPSRSQSSPRPAAPRGGVAGRSSPPPHIVGQIVEMGFTPSQARQALSKTSDGLNVQEALDMLLQNGNSDDHVEAEWKRKQEDQQRRRARREEAGGGRGGAGPSRGDREHRDRERREEGGGGVTGTDYDKYIAQASEISQNVLSKASSFWTAGKERAMKVYEEQRRVMEQGKAPVQRDRPRWMEEAESGGDRGGFRDDGEQARHGGGFSDDTPPRPNSARNGSPPRQARRAPTHAAPSKAAPENSYLSVRERADLLFSEEPSSGYKSPARHRKSTPTPGPPRTSTPAAKPPTPRITRTLVDASPAQLASASGAKAKGNEHFKLGRFSEADTAYTTAINALPDGHLLLIPLWNNRAAAKLKLGEAGPAASDCTSVIDIVGLGYHPSKENPLPSSLGEIKLGDALVKALLKRAQAWEMAEKYRDALGDYEKLMSLDPSILGGSRNLAADGARRARQMLDPPKAKAPQHQAPKKPTSRPPPRIGTPTAGTGSLADSTAVQALRKAAIANDQEDAQRLALKDGVDAKLAAWKSGKEANLRALIASLDTVLWEGIMAGVKVGMHELITEKQVKIRYMKVIARLHPDKNTTLEQRMLANGVFGALNDAWQAFQNT